MRYITQISRLVIMQKRTIYTMNCIMDRYTFRNLARPLMMRGNTRETFSYFKRLQSTIPQPSSTNSFVRMNKIIETHNLLPTTSSNKLEKRLSNNRKPFLLADIGEGIAEVELIQWYVGPGDSIRQFDKVCEVQSDKATVDITSRFDGIVDEICGQSGDVVKVGKPLLFLRESSNESTTDSLHNIDRIADQLNIPSVNLVQPNDSMNDLGPRTEYNSPDNKHDVVSSNSIQDLQDMKVLTSPAVRKLGKDNGINLMNVLGSGPQGRIMKSDVLKHINELKVTNPITTTTSQSNNLTMDTIVTPAVSTSNHIMPLRGYHRLMATAMQSALQVPHMCYGDEVNVTSLRNVREDLNSSLQDTKVKLSYLPFAIKACSLAIKEFPIINSSIDITQMVMIFHEDHNIGIAMDSPRGLVVPVISKCQDKSIFDIAIELKRLQEKVYRSFSPPVFLLCSTLIYNRFFDNFISPLFTGYGLVVIGRGAYNTDIYPKQYWCIRRDVHESSCSTTSSRNRCFRKDPETTSLCWYF